MRAALEPHWNWRELSLPGSSPPEYARIATAQATARPERGAAIVRELKDEVPHAAGYSCGPSEVQPRLEPIGYGRRISENVDFLQATESCRNWSFGQCHARTLNS